MRVSSLRTMRSDAAAWPGCQPCEPSSRSSRSAVVMCAFERTHGSIAFAVHASTAALCSVWRRCGNDALSASSTYSAKPRTGRSELCSSRFMSSSTTP